MNCVASVSTIEKDLRDRLMSGRERAQALKTPVLVSQAQPVSCAASPLSLFAASSPASLPRTFWGQPAQNFWLVAHGRAAVLSSIGDNRFDTVIREHRALMENAVIQSPSTRGVGPLFLGGFRYDPHTAGDPFWRGFPDALMALPRFLFTQANGDTWLTINTVVLPDTDPAAVAKTTIGDIQSLLEATPGETHQPTIMSSTETSRQEWSARVQGVIQAITDGRLTKVVLARQKVLGSDGPFSVEKALDQLCRLYPACTVFAIDNGEGRFIGATPESLARVEGKQLNVSCLAGSTGRGNNPEEDRSLETQLLASAKERREHATVRTMLAAALKDICEELHWDEMPRIAKLKNVQHLFTPFTGTLHPGCGILDVVKKLHPTPAVAGTPTDRALEMIREIEGDRGWYAAPVGWMDRYGSGEFAVAIRSALLRGNDAVLYAGAGIVEGSDAEQEFIETETKLQPMLAALSGS